MYPHQSDFLHRIVPAALALQERTGLPASVVLAQAILESDWGRSGLAREHNNYFGIKTHNRPFAPSAAHHITTEFHDGEARREPAAFAYYNSIEACLDDYARVLSRGRYAPARAVAANPAAFARALQRCGYATDPRYAHKLVLLIRRYQLDQYDRQPHSGTRGPTTEIEST